MAIKTFYTSENCKRFCIKRFLWHNPLNWKVSMEYKMRSFSENLLRVFDTTIDPTSAKPWKIEHKHCKMSLDSLKVNYIFLTRSFFYGNNNYPFNIFSNIRMFVVPLRLYNLFSFRSICLQKRNQPSSAKPTSHKYMKPTQINTFEPMIKEQFFFVFVYIHSSW